MVRIVGLAAINNVNSFCSGVRLCRALRRAGARVGAIPLEGEDSGACGHQQFPRRNVQLYGHVQFPNMVPDGHVDKRKRSGYV